MPRPRYVTMQFADIWAAFMPSPAVRAWLFNNHPLAPTEAFTCVTNHPEPMSFVFGKHLPVDPRHLDNFGELGTLLFHVDGAALGVTFNDQKKQPVIPIAYKFTGDEEFLNETVVVRRCAIRRAPPPSTDLIRLQLDWFESGVLAMDWAVIPAAEPDLRPAVGFAIFGHRFYRSTDAAALHAAAHSAFPDPTFLDATSPLLSPLSGFVTLDGCDSQFQTPCMFCAFRQQVVCHCPAPLRRRVLSDSDRPGSSQLRAASADAHAHAEGAASNSTVVWDYYAHRMKGSLTKGTFLTNWRYIRPSPHTGVNEVVCSVAHVVPYHVMFTKTGKELPIIQRVLTTLGMATQTPTLLDIAQLCYGGTDQVADAEVFMELDDSDDAAMSLDISAVDAMHGDPGASAISMSLNGNLDASTSPASMDFGDPDIALTPALAFGATDFAQIDASRKRFRVSPGDSVATAVSKRMQLSIEPAEIAAASAASQTPAPLVGSASHVRKPMPGGPVSSNMRIRFGGGARIAKKEARKWQCDQCDAVIRGKRSNLTRHVQNKHSNLRAFACNLADCGRRFQTRLNLERHQRLVHEGRPYVCAACPRTFKTSDALEKHAASVHATGSATFACEFCGGCYGKRSTLSRHVASVHKVARPP